MGPSKLGTDRCLLQVLDCLVVEILSHAPSREERTRSGVDAISPVAAAWFDRLCEALELGVADRRLSAARGCFDELGEAVRSCPFPRLPGRLHGIGQGPLVPPRAV